MCVHEDEQVVCQSSELEVINLLTLCHIVAVERRKRVIRYAPSLTTQALIQRPP